MGKRRPIILIFLLCVLSGAAFGETLVVGSGAPYGTVSSAVAAAKAGDEILVQNGRYVENIVLDKNVTVAGSGAEIVGTGKGSVITVVADGCVVRGLKVTHSGGDLQAEDAGILLRSNSNTIENNELRDVLFGIYLYNASSNTVRENTIVGRAELEVGERGAGLHLWNSANNRLDNNKISLTRDGMYVQSSPGNIMTGNDVSLLRYGLHFMSSDHNRFEGNIFHDNVAGAAIMYSEGIELRRNAFIHNRGFSSFGILFQDCRKCLTEENLITDNATGVFLEALRDSVFSRNTISENDVAAQIFSSSENNVFARNNFVDNISPVLMVGKSKSTAWSSGAEGNYWSDYSGYDMDADGIGDVPHKIQNIFEYLEGSFPRLRLYLDSPAAQSMVAAERSMPIIRGSSQFDPKPLMYPVETGVEAISPKRVRFGFALTAVSILMLAASAMLFKMGAGR